MSLPLRMLAPGGGGSVYADDVFSAYPYTGNSSTLTINNGINLSGKGGMVWIKRRDNADSHFIFDTARGATYELNTNTTDGSTALANSLTAFNSNGFSLGSAASAVNTTSGSYMSWTFREQERFFDVVSYTGDGNNRTIAHSLNGTVGMIIVKRTDVTGGDWIVGIRGAGFTYYYKLNATSIYTSDSTVWQNTTPTSSVFSLGTSALVNASGVSYVAYLFGHDTTSSGLIQCGTFSTDVSGNGSISLGWEPQFVMIKSSNVIGDWNMLDTMRGLSLTAADVKILANATTAESSATDHGWPTPSGFEYRNGVASATTLYVAIRRPNKPPTGGTDVLNMRAATAAINEPVGGSAGTSSGSRNSRPQDVDLAIAARRAGSALNFIFTDRLRGFQPTETDLSGASTTPQLSTSSTAAETVVSGDIYQRSGIYDGYPSQVTWDASASVDIVTYALRRAPGFMDIVCYTGTGSNKTETHRLGVAPELMIVKNRSDATGRDWAVWHSALAATEYLVLNTNAGKATGATWWNSTAPTSTTISVGTSNSTNESADTFVAYLFASVSGISKVGSYTGNGTTQTINCGFTAGARFVLIKRTDTTGDWYVFDSARGIIAGNDPFLKLNGTAAEATTYDAVDPDNSGFIVNNDGTNFPINVNTATYVYFAIA